MRFREVMAQRCPSMESSLIVATVGENTTMQKAVILRKMGIRPEDYIPDVPPVDTQPPHDEVNLPNDEV